MFNFFKRSPRINFDTFNESSQRLANAMESHGVFCTASHDHAAKEKRAFLKLVASHAKKSAWSSKELRITYNNSGVHLVIMAQIVDGVASYRYIDVWNHTGGHRRRINREQLNADAQNAVGALSLR